MKTMHAFKPTGNWLEEALEAGEATYRVKISPKLAKEMLEHNTENRPLSRGWVKALAREIERNHFSHTKQPVIFASDGRLLDGQHRLAAVLEAGKTVEFDVAFGADPGSFSRIDRHKRRTAADIFAICGVPYWTNASSAIRWVMLYDQKKMWGKFGGDGGSATPEDLYAYYLENERLQDSMWVAYRFTKSKLAPPSLMVALHYICARKHRGEADAFFKSVGEGFGFKSTRDPAYKLYQRLQKAAIGDEKYNGVAIAALTIAAWNAHRTGAPFRAKIDRGAAFPRAA